MTDKLVKVLGYAVTIGSQNIILTKTEIWQLFYDVVGILNVPIEEDVELNTELQ